MSVELVDSRLLSSAELGSSLLVREVEQGHVDGSVFMQGSHLEHKVNFVGFLLIIQSVLLFLLLSLLFLIHSSCVSVLVACNSLGGASFDLQRRFKLDFSVHVLYI